MDVQLVIGLVLFIIAIVTPMFTWIRSNTKQVDQIGSRLNDYIVRQARVSLKQAYQDGRRDQRTKCAEEKVDDAHSRIEKIRRRKIKDEQVISTLKERVRNLERG